MSERDGYQAGVPCWVDTWQPDIDRAATFYAELFGWDIEDAATPGGSDRYILCKVRGLDVAGIHSSAPSGPLSTATWLTHIWVVSADEVARKATDAGGRVLIEPSESFDGGRMAILGDPSEAVFGVWEPDAHRGAGLVNELGAWTWSGLNTKDPQASNAFYGAVFGWQADVYGTAEREIVIWRLPGYVGGQPLQPVPRDVVAGTSPMDDDRFPQDAKPYWGVDFWVADAGATADQAAQLGGRIISPPFETSVGESAVLIDPFGAEFSVSRIGP